MRVKFLIALALVAIIVSMLGCTATKASGHEVPVDVTYDDFMKNQHISRSVEIPANGTLTVTLFSNPTTGFRWSEEASINDGTVLEQTGHEYVAPGQEGVVGAGGQEVWTFKALEKGETTVSMEYGRPSEGGEKGEWIFKLIVTVK